MIVENFNSRNRFFLFSLVSSFIPGKMIATLDWGKALLFLSMDLVCFPWLKTGGSHVFFHVLD